MTASPRDFLVERLVSDCGRGVDSGEDGEEKEDTCNNDHNANITHSDNPINYSTLLAAALMGSYPISNSSTSMYTSTLASLARMQSFMHPPSPPSALPFLYPHLYQSLMTSFPHLRHALQSPLKVESVSEASNSPPGSHKSCTPIKSPDSSNKMFLAQSAPCKTTVPNAFSPRKRPNTCKKVGDSKIPMSPNKKPRAAKKLMFDDEETVSPVSGMFIKQASAVATAEELQAQADQLDESAKFVEVTDVAKAELAAITNVIGDYICRLCKVRYEDAFRLAQHKCPRISHEEYRCPECSKLFSCPANLASHRRWHKPRHTPEQCGVPTQVVSDDEPLNLTHNSLMDIALKT